MDLGLRDKVAIVTGGSRGLGRAISLGLAAEGAKVAVNYRENAEAAEALVAEIARTHGTEAVAVSADVSQEPDVEAMFRLIEARLARIDVLVNSAGVWPTAYVKDMTLDAWNHTLAVNLTGPLLASRGAVRRWLAMGVKGRIVNISSQAAFHGSTTGHAHYAASKAGLVALTISLAREVAPHGIRVNAIAAGMMDTDMARDALERDAQAYLKRIPLGRIADPAEIARVAVFLASDRASYMTGATVNVTGGMLMR
ncbi:MAG TPA: SDR family oxidoreductase [Thermoguttaceae bacterium]|nr:SDR family oxidoreductase [Thermoguttaceae bacterium]